MTADCFPLTAEEQKKWKWKRHKDIISLLVEPFSFAFLRPRAPAIAWLGLFKCITWATPVTARGTPSDVSIFSQRQRMVIISRDILSRQAAGSRNSRGKTLSWMTAVRNVSHQEEEEREGIEDTTWRPVQLLSHSETISVNKALNKLQQTNQLPLITTQVSVDRILQHYANMGITQECLSNNAAASILSRL